MELAVAVDMSLSLAQSGQMISSPSVMKPLPAMESWHIAHIKHCECQWRPSNEIKRVPPAPVMGLLQAVHRLANSSPKQIALGEKIIGFSRYLGFSFYEPSVKDVSSAGEDGRIPQKEMD